MTDGGARRFFVDLAGVISAVARDADAPLTGRTIVSVLGGSLDVLERAALARTPVGLGAGRVVCERLFASAGAPAGWLVTWTPERVEPELELELVVGRDAGTRSAFDLAHRFARTDLPLLLAMEPGCGASRIARAVHEASDRRVQTMLSIAAGLPAQRDVLDAPLGDVGTLFVEQVDAAPAAWQARLVRELDTGALADCRLIVSSAVDLRAAVEHGAFDRALYQLVRGAAVRFPPLRERDDLPSLVERAFAAHGIPGQGISPQLRERLASYRWPGNLEELLAAVAHAVSQARGRLPIDVGDLPPGVVEGDEAPSRAPGTRRASERTMLEGALRLSGGNVSAAARRLGVARSTLYRMAERHGIELARS